MTFYKGNVSKFAQGADERKGIRIRNISARRDIEDPCNNKSPAIIKPFKCKWKKCMNEFWNKLHGKVVSRLPAVIYRSNDFPLWRRARSHLSPVLKIKLGPGDDAFLAFTESGSLAAHLKLPQLCLFNQLFWAKWRFLRDSDPLREIERAVYLFFSSSSSSSSFISLSLEDRTIPYPNYNRTGMIFLER